MDSGIASIIVGALTLIGSVFIYGVSLLKLRQEKRALVQHSNLDDASAAESALRSVELATKQMNAMQLELYTERQKRMDLEGLVASQKSEYEAKFAAIVREQDLMRSRIRRLEAQITSMGKEPVE